MPILLNKETIKIKNKIGQNLALRASANELFDYIDSLQNMNFIVDFEDVYTTSRSFIQQFVTRMEHCTNQITLINEPYNIKKMFEIVKTSKSKETIIKSKRIVYFFNSTAVPPFK